MTGISVALLVQAAGHPIVYWFGGWTPRNGVALGVAFAIDQVGAALATLGGLLMTAALVFSWRYFEAVGTFFHALMLVFLAAVVGFCLSGDLFNLFVFFELLSVAAYALAGYRTEDPGSLQGALNFAVTNSVARSWSCPASRSCTAAPARSTWPRSGGPWTPDRQTGWWSSRSCCCWPGSS